MQACGIGFARGSLKSLMMRACIYILVTLEALVFKDRRTGSLILTHNNMRAPSKGLTIPEKFIDLDAEENSEKMQIGGAS